MTLVGLSLVTKAIHNHVYILLRTFENIYFWWTLTPSAQSVAHKPFVTHLSSSERNRLSQNRDLSKQHRHHCSCRVRSIIVNTRYDNFRLTIPYLKKTPHHYEILVAQTRSASLWNLV